jgi:hypothetical protein
VSSDHRCGARRAGAGQSWVTWDGGTRGQRDLWGSGCGLRLRLRLIGFDWGEQVGPRGVYPGPRVSGEGRGSGGPHGTCADGWGQGGGDAWTVASGLVG